MGKIIASYDVKVVQREPDTLEDGEKVEDPLTIEEVRTAVGDGLGQILTTSDLHVEATRTDI